MHLIMQLFSSATRCWLQNVIYVLSQQMTADIPCGDDVFKPLKTDHLLSCVEPVYTAAVPMLCCLYIVSRDFHCCYGQSRVH